MKFFLTIVLFTSLLLLANRLIAQQNKPIPLKTIPLKPNSKTEKDTTPIPVVNGVPQQDIGDVLGRLFKSKPTSEVPDSIGSKPLVSIAPAIGYTLLSRFALVLSGNAVFRKTPQSRISSIIASISYTQNKQLIVPVQTNIWSKDNTYNFVGNYRFYKYPQSTYGLGSSSNMLNVDPMDYSYFRFSETVLRHVAGNFYAGVGYIMDDHWNISDKGTFPDYENYGKLTRSRASGFTLNALVDSRDNAINPSKGGYASAQYRTNYGFLGSTSDWTSLIIDVRKYYRFPEGSDNVLAFWSYDWLILKGRPAYLDLPSTEWDEMASSGRGYIQGRFRGAQMVYLEGEYRFKITKNGLLGGVVFVNAESFSAAPGTGFQTIQPGFGPGLRLKLNKTSNTNITIDYGFGRQGSNGLFIDIGENF